jgi:hypothetical protein
VTVEVLTISRAALRRTGRIKLLLTASEPMSVTLEAKLAPVLRRTRQLHATALEPDGIVFGRAAAKRTSLPVPRSLRRSLGTHKVRVAVQATSVDTGGGSNSATAKKTLR